MSAECRTCGHDLITTIDDDFCCLNCENKKLKAENARLSEALEYAKCEMLKGGEDFDYWAETKIVPEIERILEKSYDQCPTCGPKEEK